MSLSIDRILCTDSIVSRLASSRAAPVAFMCAKLSVTCAKIMPLGMCICVLDMIARMTRKAFLGADSTRPSPTYMVL